MKYLVWDRDNGSCEDARPVEADTARDAATDYAEREFRGEPFDTMDVCVLPIGAQRAFLFCVEAERDVSFYAFDMGKISVERSDATKESP